MKRLVVLVTIALCLLGGSALCENSLKVVTDNFIEFDGDTGYYLAKVENTGTAPIATDSSSLVLFDEDNALLATSEYVHSTPSYLVLQPGEYAYVYDFVWDDALEDGNVGSWMFSAGSDDSGYTRELVDCEARFELNGGYDNYIYVTFTNSTDTVQYDYSVAVALYDTDGKLVFVDGASWDSFGIAPQSTVTYKIYIDADYINYYTSNSIEIDTVDALVYLYADD